MLTYIAFAVVPLKIGEGEAYKPIRFTFKPDIRKYKTLKYPFADCTVSKKPVLFSWALAFFEFCAKANDINKIAHYSHFSAQMTTLSSFKRIFSFRRIVITVYITLHVLILIP